MALAVSGHPLHSRSLSVRFGGRPDGALELHASLVDLRKRGFVPLAGDLQAAGVIHHMTLDGVVETATATLVRLRAAQPVVAFEPSPATGGESCRDPLERVRALDGARLDAGFPARLRDVLGGPRGCSHLVTLAQLVAASAAQARAGLAERGAPPPAGQRVFQRDLCIDGFDTGSRQIELALQQSDLHFAPVVEPAPPMQRLERQHELALRCRVDLASLQIQSIGLEERRRGRADFDTAAWRDRGGDVAPLEAESLAAGAAARLRRRFGAAPGDAPLLAALLNLAPACIQCAAGYTEELTRGRRDGASLVVVGGAPDSCYMWRRDGALGRLREREIADGLLASEPPG